MLFLRLGRWWLPIPVILVWPLLLAMILLGPPLFALLPIRGTTPAQRAQMPLAVWQFLGSLRGLKVDVKPADGTHIAINCW